MKVFFDVDRTLTNDDFDSIRPRTRELMEKLTSDGHTVYLWSRSGQRHCEKLIEMFPNDLSRVVRCFTKPFKRDMIALGTPAALAKHGQDVWPDVVVDNGGAHLIEQFGGFKCAPYKTNNALDDEFEKLIKLLDVVRIDLPRTEKLNVRIR